MRSTAWPSTPTFRRKTSTRFLAGYDLGELLSYKGIAEGVENSNFLLHTGRLLHPDALREAGRGRRPAVLPRADGASRRARHHLPAAGEEPRAARRSAGSAAGRRRSSPSSTACGSGGPTPAIAPRSARRWRACISPAPISRARRRNALSVARLAAAVRARGRARRQRAARSARDHRDASSTISKTPGRADLPQGVIHADLFPDNVFFLGDKLSGPDRLLFRLHRHARLRRRDLPQRLVLRARSLLQRHQGPRPAAAPTSRRGRSIDAELEALPLLARGAALRFLLTRLVDWLDVPPGALVRPKDPLEYFRKLRFHQKVASARDYGIRERGRARDQRAARHHPHRRRLLGQSRSRRLGRDPALRASTRRS